MGFLSDLNRKRKKVQKKILNPVVKSFSKLSDKLIPNELRFLAPYAAGIGTLMLPPGVGPAMRGLYAAGLNAAGQVAADETPIEDISDLNTLSMALAGGLGALGSKPDSFNQGVSGANKAAFTQPEAYGKQLGLSPIEGADYFPPMGTQGNIINAAIESGASPESVSFLEGLKNVSGKGLESLQDYVQGTRSTLADIGKNPGSLFDVKTGGNILKGKSPISFPGVSKAAGALAPTLALGTADVAYEAAIDAQKLFDETEAAELAEAGASLEEIQNARRAAIREAMESAQFTDQDILDTLAEIGLKDGGIASLKNGGILGFNDGGRVGFADGDHVKKNLGYREREGDSMPMPMPMPMPMGLGIPPSGNYADNFSNQSSKTLTVDNSNPYSNDKRRENVIQAMMAAKHSQATIDEALGELGLKNGGIIGLKDGGMLDLGGNEMDYRGGGFIPMGSKERADDVPARLSKNEFVMTADAVRAAGGGSVNKGAQRMYDIMNRLEARA